MLGRFEEFGNDAVAQGFDGYVFAPVAGSTARGVSTSFDLPPWNGRERLNALITLVDGVVRNRPRRQEAARS